VNGNIIYPKIEPSKKILYGFILFINDAVFLLLSCFLAYYLRYFTKFYGVYKPTYLIDERYLFYSAIFVGVVLLISAVIRLYNIRIIYLDPVYYLKLLAPIAVGVITMILIGRYYERFPFSRLWILTLVVLSLIFFISSRFVIAIITKKAFRDLKIYGIFISAGVRENLQSLSHIPRFKKKVVYGVMLLISDTFFLVLAFYLSYYLRFNRGVLADVNRNYQIDKNYVLFSIIFIITAIFIFFILSLYDRDKIYKGSGYYSRLVRAVFLNIIVIILAGYLFNLFTFSRKWILLLFVLSLVFLYISRYLFEFIVQKYSQRLDMVPKTLIIGIGENAKRIEDSLRKYSSEGDIIVGHVDKKQRISKDDEYAKSRSVIGHLEDLKKIMHEYNVQRVIISGPEFKYFEILEILEDLKGMDATVLIFPGFFEFSFRRLSVREIGGVPLMQVSNIGFFGINLFLKNFIDYVLGSIFFIIFIPIYLFVGMLIKLDSRGPVFFMQQRVTKDKKVFNMYKFRTMYIDAEERLKDLVQFNEADGPMFKMKNDPRITRVGRFLRRFSIDEIPQIINVLKGDLSLVGPRALILRDIQKHNEWESRRLNVKQGITGLWQISGRSDLAYEEMARLDLYYIQNWSIGLDIKILIKTIGAVLFGKGAY
jgi:exopolysaccharide biosynthesis polyprenyl glycosylphosphotransferase